MSHPHRSEAHEASRTKMRAVLGHAGGGHAHLGGSHSKRADEHGRQKNYDAHTKTYRDGGRVAEEAPTPRLDKRARGGTKGKKGDVNVAIVMPRHQSTLPTGAPVPAAMPPPAPPSSGPPPPMPPAMGAGANPMANPAAMAGLGQMLGAGGGKPPFARGGKVKQEGDTPYDLKHWAEYAERGRTTAHRAAGGRVERSAGVASGVGRLENAHIHKHRS